ncbi:MAG: hypothetical protein AB1646_08540 [Thermodesulfobacteriota bacterium]
MDMNSYCGNLSCELKGWQQKVQDVVSRIDEASCGQKTYLTPQVNELHMILEEFDARISQLKTECTTSWAPGKTAVMGTMIPSTSPGSEMYHEMSPGDYGG